MNDWKLATITQLIRSFALFHIQIALCINVPQYVSCRWKHCIINLKSWLTSKVGII